ncbi:putative lipid II flippase FtsW [candidate division TA06 bacterium]|nr:putative lipid II flippase FtsW [candidate division TA06 bacterium]
MNRFDTTFFLTTLGLLLFGTVMVYSSSAFLAERSSHFGSGVYFLKRHLFRLLLGLVALIICEKIDYRIWRRLSKPLLLFGILLLVVVFLTGREVHGTRRWLRLSFLSIQPSELVRLFLIVYLASFLSKNRERIKKFSRITPSFLLIGLITSLILLQPNFGTAFALLSIAFLLLFVGGARISHLTLVGLCGLATFFLLTFRVPYAQSRVFSFLKGGGYQIERSLLGVGAGGIFGAGLGTGREKLLFLPEPHTDFIFATLAEELGFLGGGILLFLYLLLFYRGFQIALKTIDPFGSLLAFGLILSIFIYVFLHIGVVLGVLPTTGLPLPFISFGGTALLVNLISIGILLNISKSANSRQLAAVS